MNYGVIEPAQAKHYKNFIQKQLWEDELWEEHQYFAAYDDEQGVVGIMVADATEEGPQLLSIGISSSLCGQGIGTELLDFAIEQLTEQYMPLLEETPLTFWAEEARKPDEWESLSHFLMKNGFQEKETTLSSAATLEELLKSKTIVRALKRKKSPNVFSLKELPPTTLRAFSNACIEEKLYPGIRKEDLAEDVSIFYVSGQKVLACVLMREAENKALENEWFYLSPDAKNMMILLDVFSRLAEEMEKRYPPDTQISFLPVNEAGEKLLRYIVPGADGQFELRRYELPFIAPGDYVREEGYEPPEMVLEQVTEQTMPCANCKYSTGSVLECEIYSRKPGNVIYGEACPRFAPRDGAEG